MQLLADRLYIGGAFVEDTDIAFCLAVEGNRKVDLEMASIVGQLVVVQTDTSGLNSSQETNLYNALISNSLHPPRQSKGRAR